MKHRILSDHPALWIMIVLVVISLVVGIKFSDAPITGRATLSCKGKVMSYIKDYTCPLDYPVCDISTAMCCKDESRLIGTCIPVPLEQLGFPPQPLSAEEGAKLGVPELKWDTINYGGTAEGKIPEEWIEFGPPASAGPGSEWYKKFTDAGFIPPAILKRKAPISGKIPPMLMKALQSKKTLSTQVGSASYGSIGGSSITSSGGSMSTGLIIVDFGMLFMRYFVLYTPMFTNCRDTDNGIKHTVPGYVELDTYRMHDTCIHGTSTEWYCKDDKHFSASVEEGQCCSYDNLCASALSEIDYIPSNEWSGQPCGIYKCEADIYSADGEDILLDNTCVEEAGINKDGLCKYNPLCYNKEKYSCTDLDGEHTAKCNPGSCSGGVCSVKSIYGLECDAKQGMCVPKEEIACEKDKATCDKVCGTELQEQKGCHELDRGDNPDVASGIYLDGKWKDADYCASNGKSVSVIKYGSGGELIEFYCKGSSPAQKTYQVGQGQQCANGALVTLRCMDTKDGAVESAKGFIYTSGNRAAEDQCITLDKKVASESMVSQGYLREYFCSSSDEVKYEDIPIDSANSFCQNGVLIKSNNLCVDSDGKNYETKGYVKVDNVPTGEDWCEYPHGTVKTETPAGQGELGETYCEGGEYKEELKAVGPGQICKDGALIAAPKICNPGEKKCEGLKTISTCSTDGYQWTTTKTCDQDQQCENGICKAQACTPGTKFCESGSILRVCKSDGSNWNSVTCPETQRCDNNECRTKVCTDSDGGKLYEKQGTTKGINSNDHSKMLELTDRCSTSQILIEYYCGGTGNLYVLEEPYTCQYGCIPGGLCSPPKCTDSDNGSNWGKVGKTVGRDGSDQPTTKIDKCEPDGKLTEYNCKDNATIGSFTVPCPEKQTCQTVTEEGITGGACKPKQCSDSDGGNNLNKKGTCSDTEGEKKDVCEMGNQGYVMREAVCSDNKCVYSETPCLGGYVLCGDICTAYNALPEGTQLTCTIGTKKCEGNNVMACDGSNWKIVQSCVGGYTCQGGECKLPSKCSDSDGGSNLYKPGICTDPNGGSVDFCESNGQMINEYYCYNDACTSKNIYCPSYVKCIGAQTEGIASAICEGEATQSPCTDECSAVTGECSGGKYRKCGDFDSDPCLEWTPWNSCSAGETCVGGVCKLALAQCSFPMGHGYNYAGAGIGAGQRIILDGNMYQCGGSTGQYCKADSNACCKYTSSKGYYDCVQPSPSQLLGKKCNNGNVYWNSNCLGSGSQGGNCDADPLMKIQTCTSGCENGACKGNTGSRSSGTTQASTSLSNQFTANKVPSKKTSIQTFKNTLTGGAVFFFNWF